MGEPPRYLGDYSQLHRRHAADRRRGAVLLLVLVLIAITATAILSFTERAMTEISGEGYYSQRDRLRGDAYSALEVNGAYDTLRQPAIGTTRLHALRRCGLRDHRAACFFWQCRFARDAHRAGSGRH
jgi:hypothetical protein